MGRQVRITLQTLHVLKALLDNPVEEHYGLKISEASGLPTGSIYPILTRLETAGWVTSSWEDIDESAEGRRRRRYYKLTKDGAELAREELAMVSERIARFTRPDLWRGQPRPGGASA
jgi:PadR family transcriptional regulator